jgi:tetratricopeptide (TPR) repeat protein
MEVEAIEPDIFQTHNLKGAAYTKMRDFEKAEASFARAVELIPEAFHARFNLTEIAYVTGRYEEAEKGFRKLLEDFPQTQLATRRLIEYKILICKLKLGDEDAAKGILATLDYLDDTPAYYVCNAALAYSKEDREAAEEWIQSARRIYSPTQMEVFLDALVEAGWIETL